MATMMRSILHALAASVVGISSASSTEIFFRVDGRLTENAASQTSEPTFVPRQLERPIAFPVGRRSTVEIGEYSGPSSGWLCLGIPSNSWVTCRIENGKALLEGTPPSAGPSSLDLIFRNGDTTFPLSLSIEAEETISFTPSSVPVLVDGTEGTALSVLLGTRKGAVEWECGSLAGLPWASCRFDPNGEVHLSGSPDLPTQGVFYVPVHASGELVSAVESHVRIVDGPPAFRPTNHHTRRLVDAGRPFSILVGDYSGAGDWSCRQTSGSLPSWVSCTGKDRKIMLTGVGQSTSSQFFSAYRAHLNGTEFGTQTPFFTIVTVNGRTITGGEETPLDPRAGSLQPVAARERAYLPGKTIDQDVGAFSGGSEGVSCVSLSSTTLHPGLACHVVDGRVKLRGTLPTTTDKRFVTIDVAKDGILRGSVGLHHMHVHPRIITGGDETPDTPRNATFARDTARNRAYLPNHELNLELGGFSGGPEGVGCFSDSGQVLFPDLACHVVDGKVRLRGRLPASGDRLVDVAVVKDSVVLGKSSTFRLGVFGRVVTGGDETADTPRNATFASASGLDRIYRPNQEIDLDIGAFSGGPEGVGCFSNSGQALFSGLACHAIDGRLRLKGTLPSSGSRQVVINAVKDSVNLGRTDFTQIDVIDRIVTGGDETPTTPRQGTFGPIAQTNRTVLQGEPVDIDLGTFTGGPEGVGCHMTVSGLFSGFACHVVDGRVKLRGTLDRRGWTEGQVVVIKDSVPRGRTGLFRITVQ